MRLIVFSDTHGNYSAMHKIFKRNSGADCFIFLGDGLDELENIKLIYHDKNILAVSGNCDYGALCPSADVAVLGGMKIFYTHGHRYDVKYTSSKLLAKAHELDAGIVLYGHTHSRHYEFTDGVHILNPGSASLPRDGLSACYAFIDITPQGIMCAHVNL